MKPHIYSIFVAYVNGFDGFRVSASAHEMESLCEMLRQNIEFDNLTGFYVANANAAEGEEILSSRQFVDALDLTYLSPEDLDLFLVN